MARPRKTDRQSPVEYSPELAERVCDRIMESRTLREIEAEPGMPNRRTITRWLHTRPDFASRYDAAVKISAHSIVDEVLEVARDTRRDPKCRNATIAGLTWAARSRHRERYGDRMEVKVERPLEALSDDELVSLLTQLRATEQAAADAAGGSGPAGEPEPA